MGYVDRDLAAADEAPQASHAQRLSLRAVLLGLVLIPVNIWWLAQIEYVRYSDSPTIPAIYFHAVALLLGLIGANAVLVRLRRSWVLSRGELLTVYVIIVTASNIAGHDTLQILFTTISYVFQHATPENGWKESILPHVPRWLVVSDTDALQALYRGSGGFYAHHWRAWVQPVIWWSSFVTCLVYVMLCMSSLVRKQWENERLSYPIAEIPLEMTSETGFWRSRAFWWAFGLAVALQTCVFIHTLVPAFPAPALGVRYFRAETMPWRAAGNIPVSFFPFAIGLTYLLPVQLLFSCWVFFLLSRIELVAAAAAGYTTWQGFPYLKQQQMGSYLMGCLMTLWVARPYWTTVWKSVITKTDDAEEPMSYRSALIGLVGGVVACVTFLSVAGMRVEVAAAFLVLFLMTVFTVGRIRAELGIPSIELFQGGADDLLRRVCGTRAFTASDLTVMALCFFMVRTHRQFPMQNHVDAFRIAHRTGLSQRSMARLIIVTTALSCFIGFYLLLHVSYEAGMGTARFTGPAIWAFGRDPWNKLDSWLKMPESGQFGYVGGYLFGAWFTWALSVLRLRFVWWPLHPLGYAVSGSFALMRLWVPLFISWAVKSVLLRYGGLSAYRKALPFFIGLVMGEFSAGLLRTIIDLALNLRLPPNSGIGGL